MKTLSNMNVYCDNGLQVYQFDTLNDLLYCYTLPSLNIYWL